MSDNRGRGNFRGDRGRGAPRGGRGGGRGGGGENRGGGATFSGFSRGGGDERGGRGGGRGRGDYSGDRGRGRGGYGGGRGGRNKFEGETEVFRPSGISSLAPDPAVTKLEDELLAKQGTASITAQLATVQISTGKASEPEKAAWFPSRPAFGKLGNEVTLWANYFNLQLRPQTLSKYSLKVKKIWKEAKEQSKKPQSKKKDEKATEVKGKKLQTVVKLALKEVAGDVVLATEFKDKVICQGILNLQGTNVKKVLYKDEGREDEYEVTFHGPEHIDLNDFLVYLKTMDDPTGDISFPKFPMAVDAISIILGFYARRMSFYNPEVSMKRASLGSSRFFPLDLATETEIKRLDWVGMNSVIRGYFQSARPATGRLLLNANVANAAFRPSGSLADLIDRKLAETNRYSDPYQEIHDAIRRLRAICTRPPEKITGSQKPQQPHRFQKVITGLAEKGDGMGKNDDMGKKKKGDEKPLPRMNAPVGAGPNDVSFYLTEPAPAGLKANSWCTVAQYFLERYGVRVDPKYPVVNVGSKAKPVYMPVEFVEIIPGQVLMRKLSSNETKEMINFSCRSPVANATSISQIGRQCLGLDGNDTLSKFGITVDKTLLTVKGRELLPPRIMYHDNRRNSKAVQVQDGGWNMVNVQFIKPGRPISHWTWIHIGEERGNRPSHFDHDKVVTSIGNMVNFMRSMGISIGAPLPSAGKEVTVRRNHAVDDVEKAFLDLRSGAKPQIMFVVLPGAKTDTTIYNAVKRFGDIKYGVHTVHVLQSTLFRGDPLQLYANLGLKVNLKMGGGNHKLQNDVSLVKEGKTMVVGYDVTHPTNMSGSTEGVPSLVGLVASIDRDLSQWPATGWVQVGKQEILGAELVERFAGRLRLWQKHNQGALPENIVIYRDGVSEGQFEQVLSDELPRIREACKQLYPANQSCKIAMIVSVKRHQTRFYPTDPNHMGSSRNVKSGTVVDRGVTQAKVWDFFLVAHKGIQGTVRPAHYTVLLDEVFRGKLGKDAADGLQRLTFDMCHLFGRATKAVSICPPAYYADIVCTRHRVYFADFFERPDSQSVTSSGTEEQQPPPQRNVNDALKDSMYYI